MSLRLIGPLFLIAVALSGSVSAQEKPLKVSVRREWDGARTSAPLSLRAFIRWRRPELLEGRVQINFFVGPNSISRWTSPETALSDSEQVMWLLTPRPNLNDQFTRYVLDTGFQSEKKGLDRDELDVEVPVWDRRVMVVAVLMEVQASTPTGLSSQIASQAYERPFTLQNSLAQYNSSYLHVHISRVPPLEFPPEPLRLLGLDAVIASQDMLNLLRPAQVEALQTWVLAGGSLVLVKTGPLRRAAADMAQLLSRHEWSITEKFSRKVPAVATVFSPGVGQFLVVEGPLEGESLEWGRVARLSLRIHPSLTQALEQENVSSLPGNQTPKTWDFGLQSLAPQARYSVEDESVPYGRPSQVGLTRLLMPDSIRGMPFRLAATVLAVCLFCVAPGDYLLLGLIRRRKWTWVLFPLVALGFTGWMTHLAAEHNGRNDSRRWISIVDVTPENEVLRTSRLELTYGASGRTVAHAVHNQWWTDILSEEPDRSVSAGAGSSLAPYGPQSQRPTNAPASQELGERLAYVGSVPGNYVVEESVRQWAPRLQRITTLGADPALVDYTLPKIDWNAVWAAKSVDIVSTMNREVRSGWPEASWSIQGQTSLPPGIGTVWNQGASSDKTQQILLTVQRLSGLGAGERKGVFQLFSEIAPTAGPDCEDLVISRPAVLIMNEVEPGHYLVLRVLIPSGTALNP